MTDEIKVQAALIDILQREMQTAWEEVRSCLERGEVERAWESLGRYFDATNSLFTEQEELRLQIRRLKCGGAELLNSTAPFCGEEMG